MSTLRFIFIIFSLTAALLFSVHLRKATSSSFYKFRVAHIKQARLKQDLWQKQLRLENLINPAALSERLEEL